MRSSEPNHPKIEQPVLQPVPMFNHQQVIHQGEMSQFFIFTFIPSLQSGFPFSVLEGNFNQNNATAVRNHEENNPARKSFVVPEWVNKERSNQSLNLLRENVNEENGLENSRNPAGPNPKNDNPNISKKDSR